jgi:rRNA small subunit pseudouridine methyltransferase Nep1
MEPPTKKAKVAGGGSKPGQSKVSVESTKKLVVVIENATLEVVKAGKDHQLLNCDDHQHIIRKVGKNIADCRPDITHQVLLALLDSPLNKAGLLQVYIHTAQNVLIEVNPQIRIPRTFKRFCGLMVKLLHKLKIRSASGDATLLKVIRNPIVDHLPPGCRKIACSFSANKLVDLKDYVPMLPKDEPICFSIGGFAHGDLLGLDYAVRAAPLKPLCCARLQRVMIDACSLTRAALLCSNVMQEEFISFSEYPLSAQVACSRLLTTFEQNWGIL